MKKILSCLGCLLLYFQQSYCCTTFFINHDGHLVFGRNYDWVTGSGMINSNLRGLSKTSFQMPEGNTIQWVSKYGSITFNQYGKEFPTGGINEKGLVVELMWLDGAQYAAPDKRPAISVLQWIQYQLDNCATIEEVISTDKKLRIAAIGTTPLHYLVADKRGIAATIEFLNGKMVVHKDNDLKFPVLTNNTYKESAEYVRVLSSNRASDVRSFQGSSLTRFAKACSMVNLYSPKKHGASLVDYSFDILNEVAQGSFTKWSIVYDISEARIFFKTESSPIIKSLDLNTFNFSCKTPPLAFNINNNFTGDISNKFYSFSADANRKIIEQSFSESIEQINVPQEYIERIASYADGIKCY